MKLEWDMFCKAYKIIFKELLINSANCRQIRRWLILIFDFKISFNFKNKSKKAYWLLADFCKGNWYYLHLYFLYNHLGNIEIICSTDIASGLLQSLYLFDERQRRKTIFIIHCFININEFYIHIKKLTDVQNSKKFTFQCGISFHCADVV